MKSWRPTPVLRRRFEFERRGLPLWAWALALILVASFVEVSQVTRVSEVTMAVDRAEKELTQAEARRDYLEGRLAGLRTRGALEARAQALGMKPAEPTQIVMVPAAYLAGGDDAQPAGGAFVALGRRIADAVVPASWARSRRAPTSP